MIFPRVALPLLCLGLVVRAEAKESGAIFDLSDADKPRETVPAKPAGGGVFSPPAKKTPPPKAAPKQPEVRPPPQPAKPVKPVASAKPPESPESAEVNAAWEAFWHAASGKAKVCGLGVVTLPPDAADFPSSLPLLRDMRQYDIAVAKADQAAANALPGLEPGDYGRLHSVEVVKVLGPTDLLVKNLWLYDLAQAPAAGKSHLQSTLEANQQTISQPFHDHARLFRLTGYPSATAREGQRFAGAPGMPMQVVVGPRERPTKASRLEVTVLADLGEVAAHPLTGEDAKAMLARKGVTLKEFADWVKAAREKNPAIAQAAVLRRLLELRPPVNEILPAGLE